MPAGAASGDANSSILDLLRLNSEAAAEEGPSRVLLHTTLDDAGAIANPVAGIGGTSTLLPADFVAGHTGNGALFVRDGQDCNASDYQLVTFPVVSDGIQNIELDRGEIELWYRPDYDADAPGGDSTLVRVGVDGYNPPSLAVEMYGGRFGLSVTEGDWTSHSALAGYAAPLWTAGQWVHIRAVWDNGDSDDSLRLYVDGVRVDGEGVAGGWDLGSESEALKIMVGAGTLCGEFIADGIIDELIIRAAPQAPVTSTPTATLTTAVEPPTATPTLTNTPTNTPTATPTPTNDGNAGITNPEAVVTPAALPLQPAGTPFVDPPFGTTLRRVSDTSDSGGFETQVYSQLQAFSADNVYLLLAGSQGYVVRRVSDLGLVAGLDTAEWNVPRWQPAEPHTIVHYDSNADTTLRVQYTNVDTLETTTVFTFPAPYERVRTNQSFDELSEDGRWMAGMASLADGNQMIFALDLQNLELGAQFTVSELYAGPCQPDPQWGEVEPDWIGVSPLGNYLVVQWARDGTSRCSGLETFDLQTGEFVGRVYDGHQHGDLGVDADGSEFFMTFELAGPPPDNDRPAIGRRSLPGTSTVSSPTYLQVLDWGNAEHISCQGPPGVCLVTAGTWDANGWTAFEGELFLQYTDGRVLRLAHHRSSSCGYWVQPRASISRDGRYAVFASDWGRALDCNNLGRGDPYIVDLWAGTTPTSTPTPTPTSTPTSTATPTPTPTPTGPAIPADCAPDADGDGHVDIVDIQARARSGVCVAYLPLIADFWRQGWPTVAPTAAASDGGAP